VRALHYSYRTEQTCVLWIRQFVRFSDNRHPSTMADQEIERFLTRLVVDGNVSASTQSKALSTILFLYKQVMKVELPWLDDIVRAKPSRRLPVVLTTAEVRAVRSTA
jgi:site-specific recombinase XerD